MLEKKGERDGKNAWLQTAAFRCRPAHFDQAGGRELFMFEVS
jgi:hypothetical protein